MNTGLWNMDSGLAALRRPGMTKHCAGTKRLGDSYSPTMPIQNI